MCQINRSGHILILRGRANGSKYWNFNSNVRIYFSLRSIISNRKLMLANLRRDVSDSILFGGLGVGIR